MNNCFTAAPTAEAADKTPEKEYTIPPEVPAGGALYRFCKRCFDVLFSALALLVFLLPMLVISLCIKCDSRGPVFFLQDRLGKDGRPFSVYKFRTMVVGAEKHGPQWAAKDDDRCTRVGRILRKSRLDELPQFLNILFGHMSLVGPRPERAYFYDKFETYIHGFKNRLAVTPGLTGLAQVNGGYELEPEEKILYDMQYIREQSLWLDLKLIFKTVKLVFTHEGAR
ncbi:MAG: sugar transferase [Clostridia bacterium]|nr:sugar transferase [Clostridia bacterium]